jgi:hypothetical protein
MLIPLLAVLGVNLIALVAFAASVLERKRWVKPQSGAFRGSIKVTSGEIDGLSPKWRRGYGHWARDILVWTKAPFLFRNELVPTDRLDEHRPPRTDEVKRLADHPGVIRVAANRAMVEVVAKSEDIELLLGPYPEPIATTAAAGEGF